jgi:tetratricopeptide (TPR) repeat protein
MAGVALSTSYSTLLSQLAANAQRAAAGELAQALDALNLLGSSYPRSGILQQQLGEVHRSLGDGVAALNAFRRAVQLNDALADSWSALETLCRASGLNDEAAEAARSAARLARLPPPLAEGSFLLNEGESAAAEGLIRAYLQQHGPHVEGMRLLAQLCVKENVLDDAEMLLEHVVTLQPSYDDARFEYAAVLTQRRRYLLALHQIKPLLQVFPDNAVYLRQYGSICEGLGEDAEALRVYRRLWQADAGNADLLVSMGYLHKGQGATEEAIRLFEEGLRSPASFPLACLALSNTRRYRLSDAQICDMRTAEAHPGASLPDRYNLCFALAKALEDRGNYAEAFHFYSRGSALKRSEIRTDPQLAIQTMQRQVKTCTAEFFAARRGVGCPRPDPIFIVGMPRSGSTLLEQILASHSQVDGTLELPDIPRLVHQFRNRNPSEPPRYPAILTDLTAAEFRQMGEEYIEATRVHRRGAPFFVDKMPNNFRDIGFIHLILPNARIIDARREPMACCVGNFRQLFSRGMEFKYTLEEIGQYYCQYVELMAHWERVLPGKILRVQHEDVVNDLEGSVRRMLGFLNLPFEPACLEFFKTARRVRTVSSDQVRQPINRDGLESWRRFEPWLEPLKTALAPLGAQN